MSVRDDIASFAGLRGPECRVATFLGTLDAKTRAELEATLSDRALTHSAFARWAQTRHDARVKAESWGRHRNGDCACGRR